MSWAETSKINSNFVNEPLNFNNYINDISVFGSDSYVMDESNSDLWLELMSKSLAVYGHDMIHEFLYERITENDADSIVRNHPKLGQAFNSFYNTNLFEYGGIDTMLSGITQEAWGLLEVKFQDALNKYINEKTSDTSVGSWLAELFDVTELADYTSVSDIISDEELFDSYIVDNESLLFVIANSAIATVFASETLDVTDLEFQSFIESAAASIPATMQLITALKTYEKLDSFFANENCCDKVVESAQAMKAMLYSIDGFEAMLNSEICMEKVADNETAVDLIIQAITDVANSSTALGNIKSVLPGISTNLESIPDTEPVIESVENTVDAIVDTLNELGKVLNKADVLANNVDALFNSSIAMNAICLNTSAITKIANNKLVLNKMVNSSISATIIANNRVPYRAITVDLENEDAIIENLKIITSSSVMRTAIGNSSRLVQKTNGSKISKYVCYAKFYTKTPSNVGTGAVNAYCAKSVNNSLYASKKVFKGELINEAVSNVSYGTYGSNGSYTGVPCIYNVDSDTNVICWIQPSFTQAGAPVIYCLEP